MKIFLAILFYLAIKYSKLNSILIVILVKINYFLKKKNRYFSDFFMRTACNLTAFTSLKNLKS